MMRGRTGRKAIGIRSSMNRGRVTTNSGVGGALPYANGKVGMLGGIVRGRNAIPCGDRQAAAPCGHLPMLRRRISYGWTYQERRLRAGFNESWTTGRREHHAAARGVGQNAIAGTQKLPLSALSDSGTPSPEGLAPYLRIGWRIRTTTNTKPMSIEESIRADPVPVFNQRGRGYDFLGERCGTTAAEKGSGSEEARRGRSFWFTWGHAGGSVGKK